MTIENCLQESSINSTYMYYNVNVCASIVIQKTHLLIIFQGKITVFSEEVYLRILKNML